jgi:phospholipase DDHD2
LLIKYPQLTEHISNFFALGSPIGMFLTVRGIHKLELDYKLPTCDNMFNIFHPFDPIAYRCEPLICSKPILRPVLLPHHKGRKRMHIEIRENFSKVTEDIKNKMIDQVNNVWTSITEFRNLTSGLALNAIEGPKNSPLINESNHETLKTVTSQPHLIKESIETKVNDNDLKINMGKLNQGRRIDYVLQERPIESFNEYIFALAAHACYW